MLFLLRGHVPNGKGHRDIKHISCESLCFTPVPMSFLYLLQMSYMYNYYDVLELIV